MCREHVVDVRDHYAEFLDTGGLVLAVTMGSVSQVARFRRRLNLPFECLSDPTRQAYQAYQVPWGTIHQIAGVSLWMAGLKALFRGGVGIPQGDIYQLQGTFVIDRRGVVRLAHRPVNSADRTDNATLLASLRAADRQLD